VLDARGISDFDALHSGKHNAEAQLYAFDLVGIAGDDLRQLPLFERKAELGKLLRRRPQRAERKSQELTPDQERGTGRCIGLYG
jgi:ATP-dependent DNA ligase